MASEIRIGGNKYQLSTSSGGGQYYYIQTETPETTSVQQTNGEVRLAYNIGLAVSHGFSGSNSS